MIKIFRYMIIFNKLKIYLFFIIILVFSNSFGQIKNYEKNYFENGKIESEGWVLDNQKVDYWFFYYENGNKKEEGHYANNKKTKWWRFYDNNEIILKKCQFYNDKLEGLVFIYKNGNLIKAEKFKMNLKIKQWESISSFKKDNILTNI
jgi:antitoxin component YwqK of YwqJK toxin-antitoxin module